MTAKNIWKVFCRHVFGDAETLPDHARIAFLLSFITATIDLTVPMVYLASMNTEYECDIFTLYGAYYAISQVSGLCILLQCELTVV